MMKTIFLLGFFAVAMAMPSLKLPVFDEEQVRQAYMEDAEETRPKILIASPDTYPRGVVDEANVMDLETSPTGLYWSIRDNEERNPSRLGEAVTAVDDEEAEVVERGKRSLQPGAPNYGVGGGEDRNWGTDVRKDGPNTKVSIDGKHKGEGYDVEGQWSKVIRGPGKAKPDWHVGVRW